MKNILTANDAITSNSKQLETLKTHFPQCFDKHGAFIPAKLQEIVETSGMALSKEGYSLNWLGKSYARLLANENVRTLLKANLEHNNLPENANSQNMLIKGDNLEVLKHLMGAYSGKVKMIYIDPPYNTGSDGFVYQDDRKFTVEQLSHLAGIDEDEAKRILEFTSSDSNSHSAWLTFMYPRLYLAKQLLRDDGVIFISIDDNEQAQLKLLCDEVFGDANFIAMFTREVIKGGSQSDFVRENHDFIFVYASNKSKLDFGGFEKSELFLDQEDEFGKFKRGRELNKWGAGSRREDSPTMWFPIKAPSGEDVFPIRNDGSEGRWRLGRKKMAELLEMDGAIFEPRGDGTYIVYEKLRGNKSNYVQFITILKDAYTNAVGNTEIKNIFKVEKTIFDYAKPSKLIFDLAILSQVAENDIVLDFFAGSGTTAHAVMKLNADYGGNRQYICVQLDEVTKPKSEAEKAGYKSIYEITLERIKRVAEIIKAENPEAQCDFGFKQFETIPVFDGYLDEPDELTPELELFNAHKLSVRERHSLMLTWQAQDGVALTTPLTPLDLAGYTAYQGGRLVYFIEPDLSLDAIVAFLERLDNDAAFIPSQLVVFGYLLDSKTQREMTEAVKQYNNRKGIELTLDVRF